MSKKIAWIECTKAISLLLIIWIHSVEYSNAVLILTGFVIPPFFILYGYTHNNEKYRYRLKDLFITRFKSLMIPYLLLTGILYVFYIMFYPTIDFGLTPSDYLFWIAYGNGPPVRSFHLWFLKTLFFSILLYALIDRYLHNRSPRWNMSIIILFPLLAILPQNIFTIPLIFWNIDSILIAVPMIMIGNQIQQIYGINKWSKNPRTDLFRLLAIVPVLLIVCHANGFVNIGASLYGKVIHLYMFTGMLGTYIIGVVSYYLCKFKNVAKLFVGFNRHSQEVYEIHPFLIESYGTVFPTNPILNLFIGSCVSWIFAERLIGKSRFAKFIFTGRYTTISTKTELENIGHFTSQEKSQRVILQDIIVTSGNGR